MILAEIKNLIKSSISIIPGIVDFVELASTNNINIENDGLIIEEDPQNKNIINITIGLRIMSNLSAKNIVEGIYEIIPYNLTSYDIKLGTLTIYIKGTK
ncbi:hypothetical protein [Metamycoplasma hominis]|uniref:hypothetical protein n=1 Tax=Metamycoplasma hominis TaxID=2098 RepID=UPI003CEAFEBE